MSCRPSQRDRKGTTDPTAPTKKAPMTQTRQNVVRVRVYKTQVQHSESTKLRYNIQSFNTSNACTPEAENGERHMVGERSVKIPANQEADENNTAVVHVGGDEEQSLGQGRHDSRIGGGCGDGSGSPW